MLKPVRDFLHLIDPAEKPKAPRRPASITRQSDGKVFVRHSNGLYESSGREVIPMVLAGKIIAEGTEGYSVSEEEAPDFHAPPKQPLVLHRGGLSHIPVSDK